MTPLAIGSISPFFIVRDAAASRDFYCDQLGFEIVFQQPGNDEPVLVIVQRDGAMIFLKSGSEEPLPNPHRDPAARWDAYCLVAEPDLLAAEFAERDVEFSVPLKDTSDGLRGFEIEDADGYALFFGCPR